MERVSKKPEDRKLEIIQAAEELFQLIGYEKTSINAIIEKVGIAKGTFYYYFKSKEDLLEAISDNFLDKIINQAEIILRRNDLSAIKKFKMIYFGEKMDAKKAEQITNNLHHPENRALHEKINTQIIIRLTPIVAAIVEQGKREGIFDVKNVFATAQFLIAGSQFLFDEGLFEWSAAELKNLRKAMQITMEKTLGAKSGKFKFINKKN